VSEFEHGKESEMQRFTIALLALVTILMPGLTAADEKAKPTTDPLAKTAESAMVKLAGWRHGAARSELEPKKDEGEGSAAFRTAWGLLLAEEGKLDQGLGELRAATGLASSDPAAKYYEGEVLYWKKDFGAAAAAWQAARDRASALVEADGDDPRARYYLGAALVRMKSYGEARSALQLALDKGYAATLVNYQKGLSFAFDGKWSEAKDALTAVINSDSAFAPAYFFRGLAWDKLDHKDKMLVDMDSFVKLAPDSPDADKARALLAAAGG
jgi:tetratricopeptide (TPR) repeat protein